MQRARLRGRLKLRRAATTRLEALEALEARQLLSGNPSPVVYTPPIVVEHTLTPAQVAAIPTGYTLNVPKYLPDGGGGSPAESAPYTPAEIRHAYGVDQLTYDGTGQTIAIVDAYDDPTIAADLTSFDTKFGLPAANFTKATPQGTPAVDADWDGEISLDVEWAHSIAPGAKILLVEAIDSAGNDLNAAVQYAINQGASQVSMSYGSGEDGSEPSQDSLYDHPGITFLASSGDDASIVSDPATSPYVVSVGGTNLQLDNSSNRTAESAWSDGGGGPSQYEADPSYQVPFNSSIFGTGAKFRTSPDVSYDADPDTGVIIDDDGTYEDVGGTSAGSPQWAGLIALANQGRLAAGKATLGTGTTFGTNQALYQLAGGTSYTNPNGDFYDVTTGSNGHSAGTGYDEATGLGSPIANKLIPDLVGQLNGTPPTVASPARGTPNPVVGKTTTLSVLGADKGGESGLTYIWSTTSIPTGATAPTFATNGTNASKNDLVTFSSSGAYTFQVVIFNPSGLSTTSTVTVNVTPELSSLAISPAKLQLAPSATEQFTAFDADQFGNQVSGTGVLTWTLTSGGGTLSPTGLYTAPATGTIATVTVSGGLFHNSATIYVLSNPFNQTDIGSPAIAGNAADNGAGSFTLLGSGVGIGGAADQLQFAYLPLSGNSTVEAQVATVQNTNSSAQAGVMYRSDTTGSSANVSLAITPNYRLVFSYRSVTTGLTTSFSTAAGAPGDYVRIVRVGTLYTGAYSANGTTWTSVGTANLGLGATIDGGLAVTSTNALALNTSTFAHVLADATPSVAAAAKATPSPVTGTKTTLSVVGGDPAGPTALTYTWATTSTPAGAIAPTFATNGTNASISDVVTFAKAGNYTFSVTLANALGYSTSTSVSVTVTPTATSVRLTPTAVTLLEGQTQQFLSGVYDQFGLKMPTQPVFIYSIVAGGAGGKVSSNGLYTAPMKAGTDYINVAGGGTSAIATVTVVGTTGGNPSVAFPSPAGSLLSTYLPVAPQIETPATAKSTKSNQLLNGTTSPPIG